MKKLVVVLLFIASAAYGEIYTWKNARGTVFYTNSRDEIPARYLPRSRVLDVATGRKSRLATAQPGGQAAPTAPPVREPPVSQPLARQIPAQGTPEPNPAPAGPAIAVPAQPGAAAATPPRQTTRVQGRAQARQNRHRAGDE